MLRDSRTKCILKGGLVWFEDGFRKTDIRIDGHKITELGAGLTNSQAREIDCSGSYIIPGLIDLHVHTGEPVSGFLLAENEHLTVNSCLNSGITTIGVFLTETEDNRLEKAYPKRERKFSNLPVSVRWHLTPVTTKPGKLKTLLKRYSRLNKAKKSLNDNSLGCDLKLYTTYREAGLYSNYQNIEELMIALKESKILSTEGFVPILIHCEDDDIITKSSSGTDFDTPFSHTLRRPEDAEIKAVEKVLDLAVKHNYPVHIVHVSSPAAALLIREAKKSAPVSCETAPHYLFLNENMLKGLDGHRWLCTPPLRKESSRGLLLELAQEGVFDIFATDHCPFSIYDKDRYAEKPDLVPSGLPGSAALLPILYEKLVKTKKIAFSDLILRLTTNPAKIMHIYPDKGVVAPDADADLVVLQIKDEGEKTMIKPSVAHTYNQWQGCETTLAIRKILISGKVVLDQ